MDESIWTTIWQGLLAGIIIGPLARLVLPGKQSMSVIMTILLGAVGAILGGLIYEWTGMGETSGIDWTRLLIQVAVAAIVVILYGTMTKGRSEATPPASAAPPPSEPPPTP